MGSRLYDQHPARIVFMGTPSFSAWILEGLLDAGWRVAAAVSQPDRPRGRGRMVTPSPVKELAAARGIPVLQPGTMRDPAFAGALRALGAELILTAAFGGILSREVLALPELGCYNVHFSLLPAHRGPAPVARALLAGEKTTGITIFRMDEGTDTGPVLTSASLAVDPDDTAGSLTRRLAGLAREVLPGALEEIVRGTAPLTLQDDARATYAPMLRKAEGRVRWGLSAREIRDRIRALDPWPGAFTHWQGRRLGLWAADLGPEDAGAGDGPPGRVVEASPRGIAVRTGRGQLMLRSLQLEGKKRMDAADFLRGHPMAPGERFQDDG